MCIVSEYISIIESRSASRSFRIFIDHFGSADVNVRNELLNYCNQNGTGSRISSVYGSQSNGLIERPVQEEFYRARVLLNSIQLPFMLSERSSIIQNRFGIGSNPQE